MGCPSEVIIGENLVFSITTHDPDTGVLTDASAAPPYRVYEDETGTAVLNGTMDVLDTDNTTGFYTESIACSVANGFEDGKTYTIYIEATVDGDTGGISYSFKAYTVARAAIKIVVDLLEDILRNKLEIVDATGAVTLRADNSSTALLTGAVTDDLTTTIRTRLI